VIDRTPAGLVKSFRSFLTVADAVVKAYMSDNQKKYTNFSDPMWQAHQALDQFCDNIKLDLPYSGQQEFVWLLDAVHSDLTQYCRQLAQLCQRADQRIRQNKRVTPEIDVGTGDMLNLPGPPCFTWPCIKEAISKQGVIATRLRARQLSLDNSDYNQYQANGNQLQYSSGNTYDSSGHSSSGDMKKNSYEAGGSGNSNATGVQTWHNDGDYQNRHFKRPRVPRPGPPGSCTQFYRHGMCDHGDACNFAHNKGPNAPK
jgi:hypothetical protein